MCKASLRPWQGLAWVLLFVGRSRASVDADQCQSGMSCQQAGAVTELDHAWRDLMDHAEVMKGMHLRTLLQDQQRNDAMFLRSGGVILDYSREKVTNETMTKLLTLARWARVEEKKHQMFQGGEINKVEGRAVLHVALRAARSEVITYEGRNVVPEVWAVLDRVKEFVAKVRQAEWQGYTGKRLTDVVCIGIGGSYLGNEFVFEALKTDPKAAAAAAGRRLRFLSNVDPIDVSRALNGLSAETTLVVVISKTFTTAETMLNAQTVKEWLKQGLGGSPSASGLAKHLVACSTALDKTEDFGIDPANVFAFWDWVGGRFSVSSVVGALPLALHYGFDIFEMLLLGARDMDKHFLEAEPLRNLPLVLGLLAVWNLSCLRYTACAILPYSQALVRFVPHVQQLDMESNGKRVQIDGSPLAVPSGGIYFGEPGTNGQHSFYQLLHQGRTVPAEFIGFKFSQAPIELSGEAVSNHDELMSNFFAQPDALALGLSELELSAAGVPERLIPHKTFPGDRPSLSLLLPVCNAYWLGQLLSLYEHRTAVQGWVWNINSFDQYGVELGKVLGKEVRSHLSLARKGHAISNFTRPAGRLLAEYLSHTSDPEAKSRL